MSDEHTTWREGRIEDLLARIATALEQMALDRGAAIPGVLLSTDSPPWPTQAPNLPVTPIMQPLPPVQAREYQFTGPSASCPVHHQPWRTVPAGVSKKTGQPYGAFLACPERGCNERPRA
jgi:hypothetical protein